MAGSDRVGFVLNSSNEALNLTPHNLMAYNKKGIALTYLESYEEAVVCFDKALDIDRNLASAWMHKGNALDLSGHHKEALGCYDKALEIDPKYLAFLVWINRGGCYVNMAKHEKAIECYDKALNIMDLEWCKPSFLKLLGPSERENYLLEINLDKSILVP